jgi:hypothetical protein
MIYLLALVLIVANVARASDVPHVKDVAGWDGCSDAILRSDEAKQLEDIAGRTAVIELVDKRCGFRPIFVRENGRLALNDEDCVALFNWSNKGLCAPDGTVILDLFVRMLDPRVFSATKYLERCEAQRASGRVDSYQSFRRDICEVRRARK